MNSTRTPRTRGLARLLAFTLSAFAASAALAQSTDETMKLEKFTVTGSYIPQATAEPIAPVAIFTELDMRSSGATTVIQALRSLPSFVGNPGPTELDSNGGNGSTGVSLRGLGVSQTLVLIDGLPADQFANIQLIPIEAVERIEVLRDGAAIIYGPGAIGGAVNVITKKKYNGSAVNVLGGGSTRTPGGRETFQSSFVAGAANGSTSVVVSGSYFKNRTIYASQRPNSANSDGRPNGGTNGGSPTFAGRLQTLDGSQWVLADGQTVSNATGSNYIAMDTNIFSSNQLFNFRQFSPSSPGQERSSFMASVEHEILGNKLVFFGSVLYARLETTNGLAPSPFTLRNTGLAAGGVTAFGPYVPTTATGLGSGPRAFIYRSVELGNRSQNQVFNDWRWNAGLKGQLNDKWGWDASMTKYLETFVQVDSGVPSLPLLDAEIQAGRFNPFARAASTGSANGFTWDNTRALKAAETHARQTTTIHSRYYDAKIHGSLLDLPAGDVGFAAGWEKQFGTNTFDPDGLYATGSVLGLNTFTGDYRTNSSQAYFAEVKVPVIGAKNKLPFVNALDVGALARNDELTVSGTNANTGLFDSRTFKKTNPSINLHYSPVDNYLIRATWSKGFSAPTSAQVFGAAGTSNPTLADPLGFPTNAQTTVIIRGNSGLGPVTSKGWSLGVVGSPKNLVKGLSFSVDFYNNKVDGIIAGNFKSILAANAAGQGAGFVAGNAATINPSAPFAAQIRRLANGQLDSTGTYAALPGFSGAVLSDNLNIGTREVSGLEYTVTYVFSTENWGRFKWVTAANQFLKVDQTAGAGTPTVSYLGQFHSTTGDALSPGSIPRWKGNSGVTWNWKELTTNLTLNYVHHYQDDPLFVLSPALKAFYDSGATVANNAQYATFLATPAALAPRVGGLRDIKAFTTFDLQFTWAFKSESTYLKGLAVTLGANNVLDKLAPFSAGAFNDNYDTRTVNNIGRFVYLNLRKQF